MLTIKNILFTYFLILVTYYNIGLLLTNNNTDPEYLYMQNINIRIIYYASITLNIITLIILFYLYLTKKKDNQNSQNIFFFLFSLICLFLVLYELYIGSTFYYGDVRDKQGLPLSINNMGFIGSIVYLSFSLSKFVKNKIKYRKYFYFVVINVSIVAFHIILYYLLRKPWNL
jgi:hypothetical protein